nr:hypothetical protein [Thiocapsa rosea]
MSLVDDEKNALAVCIAINKKVDECLVQVELGAAGNTNVKCQTYPMDQVAERLMGVGDEPYGDVRVQPIQQIAHQCGLTGSNLAGKDNKAGLVQQAVFEESERLLVLMA